MSKILVEIEIRMSGDKSVLFLYDLILIISIGDIDNIFRNIGICFRKLGVFCGLCVVIIF